MSEMHDTNPGVFDAYAAYYDLLYQDKDYAREVVYVHELIQRHAPNAREILELGCGTGKHAEQLARLDYSIQGIDLSPVMLAAARARLERLPDSLAQRLAFAEGDARSVRLGRTFDVVVALFHVFSYQTSNDDLKHAFETAAVHLKPDGLLIFDFWYGPAVLAQRPEVRVKRLENETIRVLRIAEPQLFPNEDRVDVNYQLLIEERRTACLSRLVEKHCMRYLFKPEVELFLENAGFISESLTEWLTSNPVSCESWSAILVARRLA